MVLSRPILDIHFQYKYKSQGQNKIQLRTVLKYIFEILYNLHFLLLDSSTQPHLIDLVTLLLQLISQPVVSTAWTRVKIKFKEHGFAPIKSWGLVLSRCTATLGVGLAALHITDWLSTRSIAFHTSCFKICFFFVQHSDMEIQKRVCDRWTAVSSKNGVSKQLLLFIRQWSNLPHLCLPLDCSGNTDSSRLNLQ